MIGAAGRSGPTNGSMSEAERERVLAAAYDELTRWGIDRFSIVSLADRHGLDPRSIRQRWGTEDRLMLDVLLNWPSREITAPDTGSLRGDLQALATGVANYMSSGIGRRLQIMHLIVNPNVPRAQVRRTVWRAGSESLRIVFDRARRRGELRDGVDVATVLEMLFAPINMRALFTGEPVDDYYCRHLSELVWRAVTSDKA